MGSGDILRCKEIYKRFIRLESQMSDWVRGIEKNKEIIIQNSDIGVENGRRKVDQIQNTAAFGLKVTKDQLHV